MEVKKIYVNRKNEATIVCQSCGKWKTINVARYVNLNKPIKIKCSCKAVFSVTLEKRGFYRKNVDLYGTCFKHGMGEEHIFIQNISRDGLRFTLKRGTVRTGDTLSVKFVLDDKARSTISEDVVVRSVVDRSIGVEFVNPCQHTKKMLGFYLLP